NFGHKVPPSEIQVTNLGVGGILLPARRNANEIRELTLPSGVLSRRRRSGFQLLSGERFGQESGSLLLGATGFSYAEEARHDSSRSSNHAYSDPRCTCARAGACSAFIRFNGSSRPVAYLASPSFGSS